MSKPRYTCRASAEITVMGANAASAVATAVLPTPVGPMMTGVRSLESGPAKPAFQFLFGELHQRRSAVHVVRRQGGGEQTHDQLTHLLDVERLAGLDRRAAGVGRSETLESILP